MRRYLLLLLWPVLSNAQTLTFTAQTSTGDVSVTPVLTWSTTPAAQSCTATGQWTGTKAASGTQTLPAINTSSTYNLVCTWPAATGFAQLTWTLPTTNTNGTPYTDHAGTTIRYGVCPNLNQIRTLMTATATSTRIEPLANGTWCFEAYAVNARGLESGPSPRAQKVVGGTPTTVTRSVGITVNPQPSPISVLTVE